MCPCHEQWRFACRLHMGPSVTGHKKAAPRRLQDPPEAWLADYGALQEYLSLQQCPTMVSLLQAYSCNVQDEFHLCSQSPCLQNDCHCITGIYILPSELQYLCRGYKTPLSTA